MDQKSHTEEEGSWEAKAGLLGEFGSREPCRYCEQRNKYRHVRWIVFFIATMGLVILVALLKFSAPNSRLYWTPTEFVGSKNELPQVMKEVRFTATLDYNSSHQLYRPIDPTQHQYVGPPSPEIDAAWKDLVGSSNIFVTEKEQPTLGEGLYLEPESKLFMAEIGVMHDLHCLNVIRMSAHYYWNYYKDKRSPDEIWVHHLEHCFDSLRESIMCTGDMTASPLKWSENGNRFIPDFGVVHTCRDYDALRVWANRRDSSSPSRWPANAERIRSEGH